jgi:sugar lactone lactonase YvrE
LIIGDYHLRDANHGRRNNPRNRVGFSERAGGVCRRLLLTEIRNGPCSRVTPDGKVSVFSACGGGPNGLAIGPDGFFYLCNNGGSRYVERHSMGVGPHPDYQFGSVQRIDPKTGEVKLLYKEVDGHLLSAPNDLVFDKAGGFYFTDISPIWVSVTRGIAITVACITRCRTAQRLLRWLTRY